MSVLISHHDAERPAIWDARKREFDRWWLDGMIGDATYLRSLFIYKYTPDEANACLAELRIEKEQRARRG